MSECRGCNNDFICVCPKDSGAERIKDVPSSNSFASSPKSYHVKKSKTSYCKWITHSVEYGYGPCNATVYGLSEDESKTPLCMKHFYEDKFRAETKTCPTCNGKGRVSK